MGFATLMLLLFAITCGTFIGALKLIAIPEVVPYRNIAACLVAVVLGICSGFFGACSYFGVGVCLTSAAAALLTAKIASRCEMLFGFVSVTVAVLTLAVLVEGIFSYSTGFQQTSRSYQQQWTECLKWAWGMSLALSLAGTVPICLWRWRRSVQEARDLRENGPYKDPARVKSYFL